ncbi:putative C6 transcription factor [Aspergillus glaucus CBS 516.65]|uniref:Zn(2)-C6 fungal-type domain-containing protein n=1 Tax=Aspergillus glaucus CBS 516.65 TaxID=1160497 RepID=A0A1L9VTX2_ASPGL|nr:hypothetical protein ASPGLDRAFT_119446 [Aspergillus glaucus CBS 516.65]OJJ87342.1 hypothetical protein ASPGLDRAFT_119446 [Aspergillus glaucus CBS 516.65]
MSDSAIRKRSRVACTSCQSRKRKCSGGQPCTICAQFGTECHYDYFSRKKKDVKPNPYANVLHTTPTAAPTATSNSSDLTTAADEKRSRSPVEPDHIHPTSLEANSGAAFVRRLGLKLETAHAPRLHLFAWNAGARTPSAESLASSSAAAGSVSGSTIVDIISQDEMRSFIAVWFEKIDPCYGFIDRDYLLRQVSRRWLPPSSESVLGPGPYDAVLCGLAAMGMLFSRRKGSIAEARVVDCGQQILEKHVTSDSPSPAIITGWILRVSYLRMTASPHTAWIASCTTMHLVEAAGMHLENPSDNGFLRKNDESYCSPELRRRLFCMARHLNVWVSFELGRSRVVLHGANSLAPARRVDVNTTQFYTEIFELLPVSESLDPVRSSDSMDLEGALSDVLDGEYVPYILILVQCNLVLCIYRRLRALSHSISAKLLDRIVALAAKALHATRELTAAVCPWQYIAIVPFQVVCTLLAMDNRNSLALLGDAMHTLGEVAAAYDTDVMREAYSTAYLLILLHQRRKEEDTRVIGDVLQVNSQAIAAPDDATANFHDGASTSTAESNHMNHAHGVPLPTHSEFSWLGDLMIDMPSLQNFDLDQFLTTDVPWPLPEMGI